jgi:hypothetical protein
MSTCASKWFCNFSSYGVRVIEFWVIFVIKNLRKKIKFAKEIRFHTMESLKPCRLHNINSSTQATLINTNIYKNIITCVIGPLKLKKGN